MPRIWHISIKTSTDVPRPENAFASGGASCRGILSGKTIWQNNVHDLCQVIWQTSLPDCSRIFAS
jgi:hypothetical protein